MKICRIIFFVLITSFPGFAQTWSWTGLTGPYGGTINDNVTPSAGVTIVSTNNGVYRSTDSGATWTRMTLGSDNIFTDLEVDPSSSGNKIYAATSNGARVYLSTDAGLNWSQLSATGITVFVTKIKVAANGTIFMYDNLSRLLKSTNGGTSFTNVSLGVTVNDMDVDASSNLYISTNGQGIKVTSDGTSFNAASTGSLTGTSTVFSTVISGTTIFALAADGPHKSTNTGASYVSVKSNLTDVAFTGIIDIDGSGNIYLANNSSLKIFTSTAASAGASWSAGVAYPSTFAVNTAYFQSTTTWYLGLASAGVHKTTNTGGSWVQSSSGIKAIAGTNKILVTPVNNYLFMGWSSGSGYLYSTDNGTTWGLNNSAAGNTNRVLYGFIKLADNSILGYGNGVIRSTNELNWTLQNAQVLNELVSSDGTNLFSYSGTNKLSSTNQGTTWTTQPMTGLAGTPTKIQVDASNNLYFKLSAEVDKVNSGGTTATKLTALTATTIQDIQVVGTGIYVLGNTNTLYISTDGGTSFNAKVVPSGATALWVYDSKNMFLRTTTNNFYYSTDGGGIWTSQPLLDSQASATDAFVSPSTYLYVATSNSVVHRSSTAVLPPAAPTSLSIIGTSYNQVQLIWGDNAINEDDYVVEISVGDNLHYSNQLQSPLFGPNANTQNTQNRINYSYTGLTKNSLYFFRVKAINSIGSSAYSNEVSVTTIDQCATSIPPNRSWTATTVADGGSTATGPGPFNATNVNILPVANTTNQFTVANYDFGADPNGTASGSFIESCGKTVNIESAGTIGNGAGTWDGTTLVIHWQDFIYNDFFQATTTFTLNSTDPVPAAPSLNAYLYSGTEVLLNWNAVPFAMQYDIKRATVSGGPYTLIQTLNYPKVIYLDKNLTTGNSYYYIITARNTWGTSASSPEAGILLQNGLFRPVENSIQQNFENQQGVSWGDLDGDGDEDIASPSFVNNAGQTVPPVFYENMGDGVNFTRRDLPVLTNENTSVSRGINIFDYDNDGKLDVYITRSANNAGDLLLINNGSWNFTKQSITETIPFNNGFRSSAAADYNNDGKIDFFVGNFVSPASRCQLFRNTGGTSYTEIISGNLVTDLMDAANVNWADYDNDGDQDIFIIDRNGTVPNRLYKNNGDGTFTRATGLIFDTDVFNQARTSSWGDIDNDGDLDLYIGSQGTSAATYDRLYQNNGNGTFTSLTSSPVAEIGTVTYGSSFGDIDNDGDLDLIAINQGANSIFLNNGTGTFTKYSVQELITHPGIFEIGGSMADYDQDGFLDIYPPKGNTSTVDLPNFLYKNTAAPSASKRWIEVKLIGTQSNKAAIGARVTVITASPARTQIREISSRTGYGSMNSLIAHFGLGTAATVSSIQVKWPSGIIQTLSNVSVNQIITITEDNTGPVASVLAPANGAMGINTSTKLAITLNETSTAVASKFIKLYKTSDLVNAVETFDVTVGSVAGNTFTFTPSQSLLESTSYSVSVDAGAFIDVYGNASLAMSSTGWQFTTLDDIAPTITFTPPPNLDYKFNNKVFHVTVTDNSGTVSSATLSYRKIAGGTFTDLPGVDAGSGTWDFTIQESFVDKNGLEFYITAKDPDNNTGRLPLDPSTNFYAYMNYNAVDNLITPGRIGFGGTVNDWKILAIPFDYSLTGIVDVLASLKDLTYKTDWRLLTYDNPNKSWSEYPSVATFQRGVGYFINVKTQPSGGITMPTAPAASNNRKTLFTMPIKQGWNQVGNPYLTQINWADVVTISGLSGKAVNLKTFSGGSYVPATSLAPFEGGFFFSDVTGTLTIPFAGQTAIGGRQGSPTFSQGDWIVPLTLTNGEVENKFGGVGMHTEAATSYDQFDDINAPRFINYLEMNFPHPEDGVKHFSRDVVPQANEFTWEFTVDSNIKGITQLKWESSSLPSKDIYLYDMSQEKIVNMKENASYSFSAQSTSRFRIYYGDNLESKIKPQTFTLGDAYPNPTGSTKVTIPFTLPDSPSLFQVSLEVYDMMGQRVTTLVSGEFSSGFYYSQWNPSQELTGGLYIYRMRVSNKEKLSVFSKKIVVNP